MSIVTKFQKKNQISELIKFEMIQILLTSQRVSCSRFWTWEVAAGADMPDDPEGLMLLLAPP